MTGKRNALLVTVRGGKVAKVSGEWAEEQRVPSRPNPEAISAIFQRIHEWARTTGHLCEICYNPTLTAEEQVAGLCAKHLAAESEKIYHTNLPANQHYAQKRMRNTTTVGAKVQLSRSAASKVSAHHIGDRIEMVANISKAKEKLGLGTSGADKFHDKTGLFHGGRVKSTKIG